MEKYIYYGLYNIYRFKNIMIQESRDNRNIITLDILSKAIANRVGIDIKKARINAGFVLDIFGYDDRVIDNRLNHEDRQLFYFLEEEGMLATDKEDIILYDGREWRTHYWVLKKNTILKYSQDENRRDRTVLSEKRQVVRDLSDESIYDTEEIWTRKINE